MRFSITTISTAVLLYADGLREKHRELIRGAALVVAGNDYLASYARDAGAARVEIVPTVVDLQRYPRAGAV